MTVIAAKKTDKGFDIASDSIAAYGGFLQTKESHTDRSKLFTTPSGLTVGGTGTVEESTLFELYLETNSLSDLSKRAILDLLSGFYDWKKNKTEDGKINNSYLMGCDGRMFLVEQWSIEEVTTFYAVGAGMAFAFAAMYLGHSAEEAVKTAIELSPFCEGPIKIKKV